MVKWFIENLIFYMDYIPKLLVRESYELMKSLSSGASVGKTRAYHAWSNRFLEVYYRLDMPIDACILFAKCMFKVKQLVYSFEYDP